ncbi:TIGR03936 family radical SAM-associated protein [Christensenella hongkongensis]|uniref:TIGR03936 family radical SAM-associated protein n=1 Tax=Christensenella hongkongensis TaxID=270498 RepID=UPI0026723A0D|nr:TIGR03936 family radical SAM-associated protein [Christensenella hongkongensis]
MKAIIKYSRHGAAKYISHLDMQRTFGRAVRRARIDAEYSHGFNPHIVMSFASPLSVGYATDGDYLELSLASEMPPEELKEAFNSVFPEEIRILHVHMAKDNKKLMAHNHSALYELNFHFENGGEYVKIKDAVIALTAPGHYMARDRKGREIDIRPLILKADTNGKVVSLLLKNANDGALNPAVAANALRLEMDAAEMDCDICRKECYAIVNGEVMPFSEI